MIEIVGSDFNDFSLAHLMFATDFFVQEEVIFLNNMGNIEHQIRGLVKFMISKMQDYYSNSKLMKFSLDEKTL